jgi:hypothetical protein
MKKQKPNLSAKLKLKKVALAGFGELAGKKKR